MARPIVGGNEHQVDADPDRLLLWALRDVPGSPNLLPRCYLPRPN